MEATMTVLTTSAQVGIDRTISTDYPPGTTRFDWTVVILSGLIVLAAFLSGWSFFHGTPQDTLVFLENAVAYGSGLVLLGFLLFNQWRNMSRGHVWRRALPQGYLPTLIAVILAFLGAGLDFLWGKLFHLEPGLEASFRLPALLQVVCLIVVFTGPIRSAWARLNSSTAHSWIVLGPAILSVTLVLSALT